MAQTQDDHSLEAGLTVQPAAIQGGPHDGDLACAQYWRECRDDFTQHNIEENQLLQAAWNPLTDVWTFRDTGSGGELEKIFKSLAQKAVRGLPHDESIPEGERWKVWLYALRNEKRNFDEMSVRLTMKPDEWNAFAFADAKGLLESVTVTEEMASSNRKLGFLVDPGVKAQRRFEGTAGVISDLFATSVNYCLELEARSPYLTNGPATNAQPAPVIKQSRGGKQLRLNPAIERVKQQIRQMREARYTYQQICQRLGKSPRPMNAAWRDLTFLEAFRNSRYKGAVKAWISCCS